jgi:hypothetical protein
MVMGVSKESRGRLGATITEAAVVAERRSAFENRVKAFSWTSVDDDEPAEQTEPVWNRTPNPNKLNKALLWELTGLAGNPTDAGSDEKLRDRLVQELNNRVKIWRLIDAAVNAVKSGTTTTFMQQPLAVAQADGCTTLDGSKIDLVGLMRILHMFGKSGNPSAPRPVEKIDPGDYFYDAKDEATVAAEIRRRVRELAAGINWEGQVIGGKENKKMVWNRYAMYCGCG